MPFDIIKNNTKLEQILLSFIDILRINILIVDTHGNSILAPKTDNYGWYWASQFGFLQHLGTPQLLSNFQKEGHYLKSIDAFGFQSFAIPIVNKENNDIAGYLMVGPVILNKRLEQDAYKAIAGKSGTNINDLSKSLNEIRVVTFNSLKSILDLLFELSQYAFRINGINYEEKAIHKATVNFP